jgi:hypothetical protein
MLLTQDQPWSYSEVMQIIGRVWRKGQKDLVFVYRLIACDTADETMSGYANGKALMLEQLTTQRQLLDGIHGRDEATLAELDDEELVAPTKTGRKKKASNVKPRALKSSPIMIESESEHKQAQPASSQPPSEPQTNPGPSRPGCQSGVKVNKPSKGGGKVTAKSLANTKGKAKVKDFGNTLPQTPIQEAGSSAHPPRIDPKPAADLPLPLEELQAAGSHGSPSASPALESNKWSQLQGEICL